MIFTNDRDFTCDLTMLETVPLSKLFEIVQLEWCQLSVLYLSGGPIVLKSLIKWVQLQPTRQLKELDSKRSPSC